MSEHSQAMSALIRQRAGHGEPADTDIEGDEQEATDFDGGARTPAVRPADMNAIIRRQAGLD